MDNISKYVLVCLALSISMLSMKLTSAECPPSKLQLGVRWVSANCTNGSTYNTATDHCHCYSHCGYVCKLSVSSRGSIRRKSIIFTTTASTTTSSSSTSTTKRTSKCPLGGVWFNSKGERCRCQSFNQQSYYVCQPANATTSTSATTTQATSTVSTTSTTGSATG